MIEQYNELVAAFKDLQTEYEQIGFQNTPVYARACRALDWAEKNQSKMVEIFRAAEREK